MSAAAGDFIENILKTGLGDVFDAAAKFIQRSLVGPGALRPKVGNLQIILQSERGGHDFAVNGPD